MGCQFFRNFMCDATHHQKSYSLGLTELHEVRRRKCFILDYFFPPVAMHTWYSVFQFKFFVPARFLMKVSCFAFLQHDAFNAGDSQIIQELILHQIIVLQPHIDFMFRKLICDATHHKSFSSGLTAFNEVRERIVYILDHIIIFLYQLLYDIQASFCNTYGCL